VGDVADACINIQQMAEEEEEEDNPPVDTWRNARVWVEFFGVVMHENLIGSRLLVDRLSLKKPW
jgi:hypothetical protein